MKESQIQQSIINYLGVHGWRVLVTDAGEAARASRTRHRRGKLPAGTPDLVALKQGVAFMVEVKGPRGKLTRQQELYHEYLRQFGIDVVVARAPEDLDPILEKMEKRIAAIKALNQ